MKAELLDVTSTESIPLGNHPILIGHAPDAPMDPPGQGKQHCLIDQVGERLLVWDLGAGGGTFVNGSPVSKAALRSGDRLRLGGAEFVVKCEHRPRRYLFGVRS
jgi:pSer/pThr/pTyr-binding forkhead associated (FHA) protein